jgi:co-chaperonin GroES (HSP10)
MKIKPRKGQVLVQPDDEAPRESEYGILMPENEEQEKKAIGTVEEVGEGINDIKKGDRVIYGVYAGEQIKIKKSKKEVDYVLLLDEEVLAFIFE